MQANTNQDAMTIERPDSGSSKSGLVIPDKDTRVTISVPKAKSWLHAMVVRKTRERSFSSHTIPPIPRLTPAVRHGKDYGLGGEILIQDAEGELTESVFSEIVDVDRPALRGFPDSSYRPLESTFEVNRCNQTALSIPSQRC
jgi:hypothetical protein